MNWLQKKAFWIGLASIVDIILKGVPPLNLESSIKDGIKYIKAFGATKLTYDIPLEYTQVDYATKKGTAGVQGKFDTGIKPTVDDVKIEMKVKIGDEAQASGQTTVGSFYACQARVSASSDITGISGSSASGSINGMQNGQSVASGIVRVKDHIDIISYEYKNGNHSIYVKDLTTNTEDTQTGTYTFTAPTKNLYIFGNTTATNNLNNNNALYYCKIWVSGSLAFDAVPVIRNSDNKVGLYDKVSQTFIEPIISEGGGFVAGDVTTPTPSDPMDIYCNNGKISVLDHTNWNVITNPTSQTGQGMFINSDGKLQRANDRGAGVFIPITIGKQYTVLINKKTTALGSIIRYGQSNNGDLPNSAEQLLDWYRGAIEDTMMISFTAKRPYFVMQLAASLVEAGGIDEAVEVIEAQGGDYTFLEYLVADGDSWVETNLSGAARWVGAGQSSAIQTKSQCIIGANIFNEQTRAYSANVYIASQIGSQSAGRYWQIDTVSAGKTDIATTTLAKYDINFGTTSFSGTIGGQTVSKTNTYTYTTWNIGMCRGANTNYGFVGNIYRQQAYQNNVLVGDFIPAIRNSDSVVGFYDAVSGTFLTNAGTGTFVAGTPLGDGEVLKLTPSNDTAGVANLFAVNTYKDEQEIITGTVKHKVNVYVLNGEETAWNDVVSSSSYAMPKTALGSDSNVLPNKSTDVICSHYSVATTESGSGVQDIIWVGGSNVNFKTKATYATLQDWKDYLAAQYAAGTPVIVIVPFATEYTEPEPVPQTMQTVAGDNILDIVQAGMSGLEIEAKYTKGG